MNYQLNDKEQNDVAQDNVEEGGQCRKYWVKVAAVVEIVQWVLVSTFEEADLRREDTESTCILKL